ncbi:MAG: LysR family transcriptional regulator [Pseudomonadota bacterium]
MTPAVRTRNRAHFGRISDVDIRLIRIFRSVVACGGLSAAESELNIRRSTISRHLSDLETRLGVRLCVRGRGGFALTTDGERIYEASTRLLSAIDIFQSDVVNTREDLRGHLVIGIFDNIATNPKAHFAKAIAAFDSTAPDVTLEIHVAPTYEVENGVLNGRFHLGVIPTQRQVSSLVYHQLFDEQMFLYVGKEHAMFEADDAVIAESKYAGIGFASPNMDVSTALKLQRSADVFDQEALALLILSGRYIGFLPDHYAGVFVDQGQMREVAPDKYNYISPFWAVTQNYSQPPRLIQTFVECLAEAHGITVSSEPDEAS